MSNKKLEDKYQEWIKIAINCIMIEVASYPSFGLVSRIDNGCHQDMDYELFEKSSQTFIPYFQSVINLVINDNSQSFAKLRMIGQEQETRMNQTTNFINTHKGLIFSFGIIFYQFVYADYHKIKVTNWVMSIKKFCQPLWNDIKNYQQKTVGERCFHQYQVMGARATALSGYDVVFVAGLTFLNFCQQQFQTLNDEELALILLVFYLGKVDDTTLISKVGYQQQQSVKQTASSWIKILVSKGWDKFINLINQNNEEWKQARISPGGCADLVVITLFINKIQKIS